MKASGANEMTNACDSNIQIPCVFLPSLTSRRITLFAKLAECQFVSVGLSPRGQPP